MPVLRSPAAVLVIVLAVLGAYAHSFRGAFVLDDLPLVVHNPERGHLGPPDALLRDPRPLVTLSLQLNYRLSNALLGDGLDVRSYHAVNLLIHAVAACVLFFFLRDLLQLSVLRMRDSAPRPNRAAAIALAAALLWAVHPLNTQAVTYVIQRGESLMGLCYLLAMWAWLRGRIAAARRWGFTVGCILAVFAGLASKQVMVTAPLMILVFDRVLFAGSFGASIRRQWVLYLITVAAAAHVVFHSLTSAGPPGAIASAGFSMPLTSPLEYLLAQPAVILHYLRLSVAPVGLTFDYGWNPAQVPAAWQWTSVAIVLVLIALTLIALVRGTPWALPGAWLLGILSITSSFIPIADLAAEHRMYLPLIAVLVVLVLLIDRCVVRGLPPRRGWRTALGAGLVVVAAVALGVLTFTRNRVYADPVALWRDTAQRAPLNPRAWHNLGYVLHQRNDYADAAAAFARSLELDPGDAETRVNLGVTLKALGQRGPAIAQFRQALRLSPRSAAALNQLGIAAAQDGNLNEAADLFTRAIQSDPRFADAQVHLANVRLEQGDFDTAMAHYHTAIALRPGDADLHNLLGIALARWGDIPAAAVAFGKALRMDPHHTDAAANLARAQALLASPSAP